MTARLFCFGIGYSAEVLARRCLADGWQVAGTARDAAHLARLRDLGIETFLPCSTVSIRFPPERWRGATHLLNSVPPDDDGDPVLDSARPAILAAKASLTWVGYLSTTGVYGDYGGDWVDESSALRPVSPRAWRRVRAEAGWLDLFRQHRLPAHVFRLAGIYGPGRNALDDVRAGAARRIVKPGQVFSRIHVEDIANVLQASMAGPAPGAIYNVCDDEAAPAPGCHRPCLRAFGGPGAARLGL